MNEQSIFLAALDITDPKRRTAYLAETCAGDSTLRQRVDALFAAHERSGEFLDVPALQQLAGGSESQDAPKATNVHGHTAQEETDLSFLEPSTVAGSLGRLHHYEVREVIGRGGCGIVLKAFDEKLERIVAIKVMAPELAATSPARKRFLREARATAAIRHENVVHIYAVEDQPLPFLVMEYIGGETLQQRLDRTGPLHLTEILRIGRQICRGLGAAHANGLIHRDIKPGNILLEDGTDHIKITDFGLARSADDASMTQSGVIVGTPIYMSPEQAQGYNIDQRSDLFSLGSVLYVMCCGRPPFRAASTLAVLKRVVEDQPREIQEVMPEVPAWLVAIVARLHAKNPKDRFASVQQVGDLLDHSLSELEQHGRADNVGGFPPRASIATKDSLATHEPTIVLRPVATAAKQPESTRRRNSIAAAAMILVLLIGFGLTEATGITNVHGTVIRLFSPEGTLIVEVDDPGVSVTIDGEELVITGTGAKEIRLKSGEYQLLASKDGKVVSRELVTVTRNGRQVVRVSREAIHDSSDREPATTVTSNESPAKASFHPTGTEAETTADPDRWAAEYVLSVGGSLQTDRAEKWTKTVLPQEPFRLTGVKVEHRQGVTDELADALGGCSELKVLNLRWTGTTDAGLAHLKNCRNLTDLALGPGITDQGLASFQNCKGLVTLNLTGGEITDIGLAHFENCANLKLLWLNHTGITEQGLAALGPLPQLENLDVGWTQISDAGLAQLLSYPQLKVLNLGPDINDEGLAQLKDLAGLTSLSLVGREGEFTESGVANLRGCKNLEQLKLSWNAGSDAVMAEIKNWPSLTHLMLAEATVTDAGLSQLKQCMALKSLIVASGRGVSRAMIEELRKALPDCDIRWDGESTSAGSATPEEPGALPAGEQAEAVRQELRRRNPDFQGVVAYDIQEGRIVGCKIANGKVSDLSPLQALRELRQLDYDALDPERDAAVLREIASLETINDYSAATFRLSFPANKPKGGVDESWVKAVRTLPAGTQADVVIKKLKELNPNFESKITPTFEDGKVTGLSIDVGDVLTDLSPLQALGHLQSLSIKSWPQKSWLMDLSPLADLPLSDLLLHRLQVTDLTPLKGMPLTSLDLLDMPVVNLTPLEGLPLSSLKLLHMPVEDLAPLAGMPLVDLQIGWSAVTDLAPLKGIPLQTISCQYTQVSDLVPLEGMSLTGLNCSMTRVADLSPLKGMPVTALKFPDTRVSDLSPIKDMPLEILWIPDVSAENIDIVRGIKSLKTINGKPAAEFLKKIDGSVSELRRD